MQIPIDKLSEAALNAIIKEFILREGTDYGSGDYTLEQKVEQIINQLKQQKACIVFDPESETCNIVPTNSL
jgi:uncharacterized protein YheU (UPF0270 family)